MGNPVVWFEVLGRDGKALRKFYRDLFGWRISDGNPNNAVDYGLVDAEDDGIAGGIGASPTRSRSFATFVVEVKNPEAIVARAEHLGGKTVVPLANVPGLEMQKAYIEDPDGNLICITRGMSNPSLSDHE